MSVLGDVLFLLEEIEISLFEGFWFLFGEWEERSGLSVGDGIEVGFGSEMLVGCGVGLSFGLIKVISHVL